MNATRGGFTLLEMMVSVSILTVVSLLTFVALQSSARSNVMNAAKEEVASNLRDVLMAINAEVRQAYSTRTVNAAPPIAPEDAFAIEITNGGKGLRYCIPQPAADSPVPSASSAIEIIFRNEDVSGNGLLDDGEDTNGDGALTRAIVRRQDGQERVLGAANTISDINFVLSESASQTGRALNNLDITISGLKAFEAGGKYLSVESVAESRVNIEN